MLAAMTLLHVADYLAEESGRGIGQVRLED